MTRFGGTGRNRDPLAQTRGCSGCTHHGAPLVRGVVARESDQADSLNAVLPPSDPGGAGVDLHVSMRAPDSCWQARLHEPLPMLHCVRPRQFVYPVPVMIGGWFVMQWTISKSHENIGERGEKLRQKGRYVAPLLRSFSLFGATPRTAPPPPPPAFPPVHTIATTRYIGQESLPQNKALASVLEREKRALDAQTTGDAGRAR